LVQRKKQNLKVETILSRIEKMLSSLNDKRATALAKLKEAEGQDPFKILIGTILSHRTKDEKTTEAVNRLFSRYRNVEQLASAREEEVRELIRGVGFHNVKARNIIHVSRQIIEQFGGKVPDNLEDLIKLKSVGRKTANCVLVYGFNKPAIPVDTHVHRISNRLGIVKTLKPEETEIELMKKIPKEYWVRINDTFVRFGQTICTPVKPKCNICLLKNICLYYRKSVFSKLRQNAKDKNTDLQRVLRANV
jgi:endonuclease-3